MRYLLVALIGILPSATTTAQEDTQKQRPTSLSETYDSWTVQCANQQQGESMLRVCQMSQKLWQQDTGQRILSFAIGKAEAATKATLVLPFGLLLSEGVRVKIAENEILGADYRTCLPAGCVAEFELSDEVIGELEGTDVASVVMTAISGQEVVTDVSLEGFSAAYQRLIELTESV